MSIKSIIRNLISIKKYIPAVIDRNIYPQNRNSYCGGSLFESNMLFVSNRHEIIKNEVTSLAEIEKFNFEITDNLNSVNDIEKLSINSIGPFSHVVNIFFSETEVYCVDTKGGYNQNDLMCNLHQINQIESGYLALRSLPSTITNVYIKAKQGSEDVITADNIEFMTKGLSRVLSNHNIICNGVISDIEVPLEYTFKTISFLCGKYGQLQAGVSIRLHK